MLDEAVPALVRRWPHIAGALLVQAERQSERVALHQLISQLPRTDQRVVALLWHLADRWGRTEDGGVVVLLALKHEAIAHMVGGQRSTISAAFAHLADQKLVTRRPNGTWLLARESQVMLDEAPPPAPMPDLYLLGEV
jgi:CRP-like cAMP-binding protein